MSRPSCVNAKDWAFIVVTDPEKLAQMSLIGIFVFIFPDIFQQHQLDALNTVKRRWTGSNFRIAVLFLHGTRYRILGVRVDAQFCRLLQPSHAPRFPDCPAQRGRAGTAPARLRLCFGQRCAGQQQFFAPSGVPDMDGFHRRRTSRRSCG